MGSNPPVGTGTTQPAQGGGLLDQAQEMFGGGGSGTGAGSGTSAQDGGVMGAMGAMGQEMMGGGAASAQPAGGAQPASGGEGGNLMDKVQDMMGGSGDASAQPGTGAPQAGGAGGFSQYTAQAEKARPAVDPPWPAWPPWPPPPSIRLLSSSRRPAALGDSTGLPDGCRTRLPLSANLSLVPRTSASPRAAISCARLAACCMPVRACAARMLHAACCWCKLDVQGPHGHRHRAIKYDHRDATMLAIATRPVFGRLVPAGSEHRPSAAAARAGAGRRQGPVWRQVRRADPAGVGHA